VEGLIRDSSGAPIPGVQIVLVNADQGARRETASDAAGSFRLSGLPIGPYSLTAQRDGLGTVKVESLLVSVGQSVFQRLEMKPAGVTQSLEVTAEADALATSATTSDTALGYDRIEETPSLVRSYLSFVFTAPGAASSAGANTQRSMAGTRNAANDSGFVFGGMRGRNNGLTIDGVDNRDETTGGNRVAIGLEMVQEFRVAGAVVNAEFGGAAGGFVNAVTRSGTNLWHGDTTLFYQNELLNARNAEVAIAQKPLMRRWQPGVSLLGPWRRDKTFFGVAWEGAWDRGEEWSETPPALRAIAPQVRPGLYPTRERDDEASFKLNHQLPRQHSLIARYSFSRGEVANDVLTVDNYSDFTARASSLLRDHAVVAGVVSVLTPARVNDFRVQYGRRDARLWPNFRGPMVEIPGVITFGQGYRADQDRQEQHFEAVDSLNWTRGAHTLTLGASVHHVGFDGRLANRFAGLSVFPTLERFVRNQPDLVIQARAADPSTAYGTTPVGLWLHERWQARPGLTLEAGLRYDRQWMPPGIPGTNTNFAPRAGLAWRPGASSPWVIRAGGGLFYDRYPLAWLNDAIQKDGIRGDELVNGVPSRYAMSPDLPATKGAKVTAGFERLLDADTKLSVDFSFVRGLHMPRTRNANLALPAVYLLENTASSRYSGVTITANRRITREVNFIGTYTTGKSWDDASDFDEHPGDPRNLRADWALSRQHQRHRVSVSGLFELPVEDDSPLPAWLREPLESITIAPIFTYGSPRPLNLLATSDLTGAAAYPLSARPAGVCRNPGLGPAVQSLDVRVFKTLDFREGRAKWFLGAESFNVLNHTNVLRVNPFAGPGYGGAIEIMAARQIQLFSAFEF
jgi:hypothetical protein